MNVKLSVEKDGEVISEAVYSIQSAADWEKASADIWHRARQAGPTENQSSEQFLSGLDGLWGATMRLDRA